MAAKKKTSETVTVTQIGSSIGRHRSQRETLRGLGFEQDAPHADIGRYTIGPWHD